MEKYCIVEKKLCENHAGAKAREDVANILLAEKWKPLIVHHSEEKGVLDKLKMACLTYMDWTYVYRHVLPEAELIVQYPLAMYPKVSMIAVPFLRKLKKRKVKLIFLIHDLESLRGGNIERERLFLDEADVVIAHNPKMISYLKNMGYSHKKLISLGIFDYLLNKRGESTAQVVNWKTVAIAGNLKKEKAGYVYLLNKLVGDVKFMLYGPNYEGAKKDKNVEYKGQYPPEELPEKLECGFGLVWDGMSLEECTGPMGQYLQYNNPHKTSLYLASGIPVIVWEKAAMAELISQKGVGIVVNSLDEISSKVGEMKQEEYLKLKENAEVLGKQLRVGAMLKAAISLL